MLRLTCRIVKPSSRVAFGSRFLQVQASADKEAFLRPIESHPGVWGLALNRPKSKNAISLNLLKVRNGCMQIRSPLTRFNSNSVNVWKPCNTTRGPSTTSCVQRVLANVDSTLQQCPSSHPALHDRWVVLCRRRPHRASHNVPNPSEQVPRGSPGCARKARSAAHADHCCH